MRNNLIIICCILAINASAQQKPMTTKKFNDPEAAKILNELQEKLNACSTISIEFAFQSEKNEKITDEMRGSIKVKGNKYVLQTPIQQVFCDGISVWNYLPEQKEVNLSNYSEVDDAQMINPLSLVKNYAKQYKSNFILESVNKGVLEQIIDLTPLKPNSLFKIRLVIDKNKKQIIRMILYEKDNTQYTYLVTKFQVNQPIEDKSFVFDAAKHAGVEVIDMR